MLEGLNMKILIQSPAGMAAFEIRRPVSTARLAAALRPPVQESALAGASKKSYRRQMLGMIGEALTVNWIERGSGLFASARSKEGGT